MAYGIGSNWGIGERISPPEYFEEPDEYEYNADLGYSERLRCHDDEVEADLEAIAEVCDDE